MTKEGIPLDAETLGVLGESSWETELKDTEKSTFDPEEFDKQWKKDKVRNHSFNLKNFTGFYHGTYYEKGVKQE